MNMYISEYHMATSTCPVFVYRYNVDIHVVYLELQVRVQLYNVDVVLESIFLSTVPGTNMPLQYG